MIKENLSQDENSVNQEIARFALQNLKNKVVDDEIGTLIQELKTENSLGNKHLTEKQILKQR